MTHAVRSCLFLTLVTLSAGPAAQAASPHHIDRLALQLQVQAGRLLAEVQRSFGHCRQYRHLTSDLREMYAVAAHIHEVAHFGGSPAHLAADVQTLDRLFHHVEDLVTGLSAVPVYGYGHPGIGFSSGRFSFRLGGYGAPAGFGHGGHDAWALHRLRAGLSAMESTLHHLMHDLH